jgi:phosphatidylethanolamine-binding protein (PEBP) family uncharacterized protein
MGSAVSTPPADDAALNADEVKALIGEEKFDQAQFDQLAGEGNTTVTFAQLKALFPADEATAAPAAAPATNALDQGVVDDLEGFESTIGGSLTVAYPAGGFGAGDEVPAPTTHVAPSAVTFKADADNAGKKYTLVMTDPDAPDRTGHAFREFVHYVASDVTAESLAAGGAVEGTTVLDYLGVGSPCKSGMHRYIFLLFEQPEGSNPASLAAAFEGRGGKKVCVAAKAAGLGPVVAATWFQSQWDESIDAVHTAMGWLPPAEFRSPAQEAANPPAEEAAAP